MAKVVIQDKWGWTVTILEIRGDAPISGVIEFMTALKEALEKADDNDRKSPEKIKV